MLTLSASDGRNSALTQIQITIADVNEYPPVCSQAVFYKSIAEDAPAGTLIAQVRASDRDRQGTTNARLIYNVTGGAYGQFTIDPQLGDILVAQNSRFNTSVRSTFNIMVGWYLFV